MNKDRIWEMIVKASPYAHNLADFVMYKRGWDELPPVWTDDLRYDIDKADGAMRPFLVLRVAEGRQLVDGESTSANGGDAYMEVVSTERHAEIIANDARDANDGAWVWWCDLDMGQWYGPSSQPEAVGH